MTEKSQDQRKQPLQLAISMLSVQIRPSNPMVSILYEIPPALPVSRSHCWTLIPEFFPSKYR